MGKIKYIGCMVRGCEGIHRSRGYCRKHYRKVIKEGTKRYQKVRLDPKLKATLERAQARYKKTEAYKISKRKSDRNYYDKNKEILLAYRKGKREMERFGRSRSSILYRDNNKCALCHSTEDLIVHHIDGQGRSTDTPNNNPENLVTLCRSCHMKVHPPHKT